MKVSPQLTLGELILKLSVVQDKTLPVIFDVKKYHPEGVESWRGSYCELAINYRDKGTPPQVKNFLKLLEETIGKTFVGYKDDDFLMGKITPVWVANYGESQGFRTEAETAVVDVLEQIGSVVIKTETMEY